MSPILHLRPTGPGFWTNHALHQRDRGFYQYGKEFFRVCLKSGSLLVRAYLLGHALELFLKTYLLMAGLGERELRKLGHKLPKLLAECEARSVPGLPRVSEELTNDLRCFGTTYGAKDLEYFSILHLLPPPPSLPDLRRLVRFGRRCEEELARRLRAV